MLTVALGLPGPPSASMPLLRSPSFISPKVTDRAGGGWDLSEFQNRKEGCGASWSVRVTPAASAHYLAKIILSEIRNSAAPNSFSNTELDKPTASLAPSNPPTKKPVQIRPAILRSTYPLL